MTALAPAELAVLGALSLARTAVPTAELRALLSGAGITDGEVARALDAAHSRGLVHHDDERMELTPAGVRALQETSLAIARALDNSPTTAVQEECASVPFLTTVETEWIEAISINYAVPAKHLAAFLPRPLEPEVHAGSAWDMGKCQVDMRSQLTAAVRLASPARSLRSNRLPQGPTTSRSVFRRTWQRFPWRATGASTWLATTQTGSPLPKAYSRRVRLEF